MSAVRIVTASEIVETRDDLQRLAERVFGIGDRPDAWFERKLARHHVRLELSRIAIDPTLGDARDPRTWCGYVLLGTPPSVAPGAQTAGVGVVPTHRGRGIGRALLDAVADAAVHAGHTRLQILADEETLPFYAQLGYARTRSVSTWQSTATGSPNSWNAAGVAEPWWDPDDVEFASICAWMPEAWDETALALRHTLVLQLPGHEGSSRNTTVRAHISREGEALLVHRVSCSEREADRWVHMLDGLRDALPAPRPVLLWGIDPHAAWTEGLGRHGWTMVQRGAWVERHLIEST